MTRPVAEAMLSPTAILLAGAGASIVIATGLPLVVAPVAALAAWAGRVAVAVPKDAPTARIDPFAVPEPWRGFVVDALRAQVRYRQTVEAAERGAVRDRLVSIGARIDDGVEEAWRIARRGAQLVEARTAVDDADARKRLTALTAEHPESGEAPAAVARTMEALQSQIETGERIDRTIAEARAQLQLLDARLDESVARASELSVQVGSADELGPVGADVDDLVGEMEALRLALEETSAAVPLTSGHMPRPEGTTGTA